MSTTKNQKISMRLLLVGMTNSVHLARWVAQIADQGWKISIFPSTEAEQVHSMLKPLAVKIHHSKLPEYATLRRGKSFARIPRSLLRKVYSKLSRPLDRSSRLHRVIKHFEPQIIHSFETQGAGYLVEETKSRFFAPHGFPRWIHTNWGSDIYLFGRLSKHKERIKRVLANCDYYSCESQRDIRLAREFGFSREVVASFPNTGGFEIPNIRAIRETIRPSKRTTILLKGYQGWAGRALVGVKALELLGDKLRGFDILIYGNPNAEDIGIAAELLSNRIGVKVRILPYVENHEEMLRYFASARIYIGLSISDSISTSLLEAMAMGAFPIQSDTSTADEWIIDGEGGAIVPAEEPIEISRRVSLALTDNGLVDKAAAVNWKVIRERADASVLKQKAIDMYLNIVGNGSE